MGDERYNPLDRENLGASVRDALLRRIPVPLGAVPAFPGAGIYAIYYTGAFPCYDAIAALNRDGRFERPIYVGKAIPAGARKGGTGALGGSPLYGRLMEHGDSIRSTNLNIADFFCRYLVVDDIWIPLSESLLIARFAPIWNMLIDGFGNHDPGKGRYEGLRPRWDVLHPGREWAGKCKARPETAEQIEMEVEAHLRGAPVLDASDIEDGKNGK
jgi:hypothetical protein